ncbi:hypothetical protein B0H16DRAFT_1780837 [Mycena metata]|uniref:Uncharacterized protein n=1 Tax=Mycena metata TaxID=1033252 RepID=A0AAD7JNT6_9AGAR|nr:hypothetical protein B0H16DRAFT_1780837 [Mycena metata]
MEDGGALSFPFSTFQTFCVRGRGRRRFRLLKGQRREKMGHTGSAAMPRYAGHPAPGMVRTAAHPSWPVHIDGVRTGANIGGVHTYRFADVDDPLLKYTPILTLVTNVYCRSFIEWKIWTITQLALPSGGKKLRHFLVIVVESAALYALWAVLFLVAFETQSNLQVVLIEAGPEPIGLVNALIMMRGGLGWTTEQIEGTASANPSVLVFSDFQ